MDALELTAEHDRDAGEAGIRDQKIRTPADQQNRDRGVRDEDRCDHLQVVFTIDPHEHGQRSAASIRRQGARGRVALDPPGETSLELGGDGSDRHELTPSQTSGIVVRSPAPPARA